MFKTRKELEETNQRIQILEKRIEDYRKELFWKIEWETKIRSDFEHQVNQELLKLKKKKSKEV